MNTNDLKIFEAVASHKSFTKAAEAMFTVQSNVTARIRVLEEEFGASLFERNARKVSLTEAGEVLMSYSKRLTNLIDEAKREMLDSDEVSGSLKIGCIETTMSLKVPDILNRFADIHPKVELEFKSAMRAELIKDVLEYKLDAAFVSAPISMAGLNHEVIAEEKLLILAPENAKNMKSYLSRSEVLKIVVFDQGCIFRERLESWLSSQGVVQYKAIVVNSLEGIVNFVEAGLGISILPAKVMEDYYKERKINTFSMNKELGSMTTLLISKNNEPSSKALQEFINMFSEGIE
ncbi:MAG: LysR family transcriptional regulator [Flavobacterium psychrophilum]|nr:MAG: LysR family transcriptional regulator [Flavobacterium psychrophilum]